jgi:hypothetical protein
MTVCRLVPYFDKFVQHDTRRCKEKGKGETAWNFDGQKPVKNVIFMCIQVTFSNVKKIEGFSTQGPAGLRGKTWCHIPQVSASKATRFLCTIRAAQIRSSRI